MPRLLRSQVPIALAILIALPASAQVIKVFKHDQFSDSIATAATELSGIPLEVQAGWANGEAFGQVYRPDPGDYPVKILGVDMVMAGPPLGTPPAEADAEIEFWTIDGAGPDPGSGAPFWSVHTSELFDPISGDLGVPLTGDVAWSVDFDYEDPQNHPPLINSGDFAVVIRFTENPTDMQTEWGTVGCMYFPDLGLCGCQKVATIHDQATTNGANLMHVITPLGTCTGAAGQWFYIEGGTGVTGDIILRVRAEVSGCTADCDGKECGDDGCGGSCGTCIPPETCNASDLCECVTDCDGKECGDDGCGGLCGTCTPPETCNASDLCECVTDCDGKECGDDGCGGLCGTCTPPETCNASDLCECITDCDGKECGDDGCGGLCGTCTPPETCNASDLCECVTDCDGKCCGDNGCGGTCPDTCTAGTTCNPVNCLCEASSCTESATRCNGDVVETCTGGTWQAGTDCSGTGQTCQDGGCVASCTDGETRCNGDVIETCTAGVWVAGTDCSGTGQTCVDGVCQGCQPDCSGKACGDDGCGGNCGTCTPPETCQAGACVCVPDCSGKVCGDDGCGASCGSCDTGQICQDNQCVTGQYDLVVIAISPESGYDDVETDVSITGIGFAAGATVMLGGTHLVAVQILSSELITATVPSGMEPGKYMLVVANSNGDTDSLRNAFEILNRDEGSDTGCGCATPSRKQGFLPLFLLIVLMAIRSRRRS